VTDGAGPSRVALVTGGARGIGEAVCMALAEDGMTVAVADLREPEARATAEAIRAAGGEAEGFAVDVTRSQDVLDCVAAVRARFGPIDVLVNCAGWDELMPFVASDEPLWDRLIEINYKGPLRFAHATVGEMAERGWGRIINIGSDAGRVGSSLEAVYSGAKGGIMAFSKTLARELALKGVTVNTVCPGPTDTPFLQETIAKAPDAGKVIASMTSGVPMKRLGTPAEIAAAVRFFAREDAGFITGQTLSVSGGLTMI
jgi:2-hydroxycyclohexanecarboxyl-CoA dehydrogenase